MNSDRVIRDGKVAVLYSPGYGCGWYASHNIEALLFDPSIVKWIEDNERDKVENYMTLKYPDVYTGGLDRLAIHWLRVGTLFRIDEYDGFESIVTRDEDEWVIA